MRLTDMVRLSTRSLSERKLRAALTIIGIAIGPLALITITSVTSGYGNYIIQSILGLGQNMIVVMSGQNYKLTQDDLELLRSIEGVVDATPFYSTQGEITIGGERKTVFIYGVDSSFLLKAIVSLQVKEGSPPLETDIGKAMIGYSIAFDSSGNRQYGPGDVVSITVYQIGERGKLQTKRLNVAVTAVLDKYGGAAFLNPDQTIFTPIETIQKMLGIKDWAGILLLAEDPSQVDLITSKIRDIYGGNVDVISFLALARIAMSIINTVDFITFAATLSAFAVAIAGTASTMITSVIERTREIGVMKALGFKDWQVLLLIIMEGVVMSIIGVVIGSALGVLGAHLLSKYGLTITGGAVSVRIEASPDLSPMLFLRTTILTIFVGVAGASFPAHRAMKIPPAVALRYE
uniref:ABC transporter permease n=1 Tax=Thermosphaera aggregans TaxID=54254 RepID=A0A7C2BL17_9CREN